MQLNSRDNLQVILPTIFHFSDLRNNDTLRSQWTIVSESKSFQMNISFVPTDSAQSLQLPIPILRRIASRKQRQIAHLP